MPHSPRGPSSATSRPSRSCCGIDADGVISTVLDGDEHGVKPYDVALVGDGNLLVADYGGTVLHVDLATGEVMPALDAS
jgi:hypothetical protein